MGLTMLVKCLCLSTMATKPRRENIRAMQRKLGDETSGEQDTPKVGGSVEDLGV